MNLQPFCVCDVILQCFQYLDYIASNDKMTDELERMWQEAGIVQSV
jgi:hypothetical protein